MNAPFAGVVGAQPIERELPDAPKPAEEPKPASKFARYTGRQVMVELKNGDRLSGKVIGAASGKIMLQGSAGRMTVREGDILSVAAN